MAESSRTHRHHCPLESKTLIRQFLPIQVLQSCLNVLILKHYLKGSKVGRKKWKGKEKRRKKERKKGKKREHEDERKEGRKKGRKEGRMGVKNGR